MDFGSNLGHQHWILTIPRNTNDFLLIFGFSNKQTRNFFFFFTLKNIHTVFSPWLEEATNFMPCQKINNSLVKHSFGEFSRNAHSLDYCYRCNALLVNIKVFVLVFTGNPREASKEGNNFCFINKS